MNCILTCHSLLPNTYWWFMKSVMSVVHNPPPLLDCPQIKSTFKDSPAPVSQKEIQQSLAGFPKRRSQKAGNFGFPRWVKNPPASAEDMGSIPDLGSLPGEGNGNPDQYSCLKNPQGQRSLVGYSPRGLKESGKTEWLSTAQQKAVHILNPQNLQMISVPCLLSFFLFSLFLSFLFFSNYGM